MRSSKLIPPALFTAFITSQLVACGGTMVNVQRTMPAEVNLSGYTRVAIGGASGQGGEELVADITQALFDTKRFEVLDRAHLRELMKEQDLSASGAISDDTAVSIGNMIGSAALLIGEVSDYNYNERLDTRRQTCVRKERLAGCKGTSKKCTVNKNYPCVKYTRVAKASLRAAFKLLDTTTGKVLAVKNLDANKSQTRNATDSQPAPFNSREPWLASCREEVVASFMKVIAPYKVNIRVELLDDGDLPELEMGNNMAKIGNWQKAIGHYNDAVAKAGGNPDISPEVKAKAHYNLGIGLGYSGRYNDGIGQLETAYGLDPDEKIQAQVQKIKKFKEDAARLAEQEAGAFDDGQS